MDECYSRKSTISTSDIDYHQWYELFKRKPLVDTLLVLFGAIVSERAEAPPAAEETGR
jgi:hypothetical protein